VREAVAELVPVIATAPADPKTRTAWLERLFEAHAEDQVPYIESLADLVKTTPGDEGKWFAAAKGAGLFDEALALAARTPCDPKTLTRAARDYAGSQPAFALGAGLLALYWLAHGCGYEITSADVWAAYLSTMKVAEQMGKAGQVRQDIRRMATSVEPGANFVARILDRELGLP